MIVLKTFSPLVTTYRARMLTSNLRIFLFCDLIGKSEYHVVYGLSQFLNQATRGLHLCVV